MSSKPSRLYSVTLSGKKKEEEEERKTETQKLLQCI
jgi:hypothetical protein